jgi:hypothetical protein
MEQNQQFSAQQPGPQDPAQLQDALQNILRQPAAAGSPALNTFSMLQERRASRLADAANTISQALGKNQPDGVALQTLARSIDALRTQVANQTVRLANWPKPKPNEWLVFGTVTDPHGQPASGQIVRVFDKDRKLDDLLGETNTDANGDFSVIYHARDFKETGENAPDLYVMVSDTNGKLLYSSRDQVRFEAGKSEYFAIRLDASVKAKKNTGQTTRITRRKPADD